MFKFLNKLKISLGFANGKVKKKRRGLSKPAGDNTELGSGGQNDS